MIMRLQQATLQDYASILAFYDDVIDRTPDIGSHAWWQKGKHPTAVGNLDGHFDAAYGLSIGGKILSRVLERGEITVDHAVMDAAPLLPLPRWSVDPLRYYQSLNVWTCYHWTGFWKRVFRSHYFDVLLEECRKVWPYGGGKAVRDGYKDVYTHKLESQF